MFANLKKKIEEGGAVSPVGVSLERKAGGSTTVNNATTKTQSTSYVHGAGLSLLSSFCTWNPVYFTEEKYEYFAAGYLKPKTFEQYTHFPLSIRINLFHGHNGGQ